MERGHINIGHRGDQTMGTFCKVQTRSILPWTGALSILADGERDCFSLIEA